MTAPTPKENLERSIEETPSLPRCVHGRALVDGSGEHLEPPCGCRAAPTPTSIGKLTITVTKTTDGTREYVQILSSDQFTLNLVLIADEIEVQDVRE